MEVEQNEWWFGTDLDFTNIDEQSLTNLRKLASDTADFIAKYITSNNIEPLKDDVLIALETTEEYAQDFAQRTIEYFSSNFNNKSSNSDVNENKIDVKQLQCTYYASDKTGNASEDLNHIELIINQKDKEEVKQNQILENKTEQISPSKQHIDILALIRSIPEQVTIEEKLIIAKFLHNYILNCDEDYTLYQINNALMSELNLLIDMTETELSKELLLIVNSISEIGAEMNAHQEHNKFFNEFNDSGLNKKISDILLQQLKKKEQHNEINEFSQFEIKLIQIFSFINKDNKVQDSNILDFCGQVIQFQVSGLIQKIQQQEENEKENLNQEIQNMRENQIQEQQIQKENKIQEQQNEKVNHIKEKQFEKGILFQQNETSEYLPIERNSEQLKNQIQIETDLIETSKTLSSFSKLIEDNDNREYFININTHKQIIPLLHLQCPSSLNCEHRFNLPYTSAVQKLQFAIFTVISQFARIDDQFSRFILDKHSAFQHIAPLIISFINSYNSDLINRISPAPSSSQLLSSGSISDSVISLTSSSNKQLSQSSKSISPSFPIPTSDFIPSKIVLTGALQLFHYLLQGNPLLIHQSLKTPHLITSLVTLCKFERNKLQQKYQQQESFNLRDWSNECLIRILMYCDQQSKKKIIFGYKYLKSTIEGIVCCSENVQENEQSIKSELESISSVIYILRSKTVYSPLNLVLIHQIGEQIDEEGSLEEIDSHQFHQRQNLVDANDWKAGLTIKMILNAKNEQIIEDD